MKKKLFWIEQAAYFVISTIPVQPILSFLFYLEKLFGYIFLGIVK